MYVKHRATLQYILNVAVGVFPGCEGLCLGVLPTSSGMGWGWVGRGQGSKHLSQPDPGSREASRTLHKRPLFHFPSPRSHSAHSSLTGQGGVPGSPVIAQAYAGKGTRVGVELKT